MKHFLHNEDRHLQFVEDFIRSANTKHYKDDETQTDVISDWDEMGITQEACIANIVKYAKRYGKKSGKNKYDLYKIIHYTAILLNHDFGVDENLSK